MRKFLLFLLVAFFIVGMVFSGCAQPTTPEPTTPTPTTPEPTTPEPTTPEPGEGLKVMAITSCSKFDYSWGTSNYRAMQMIEENYGAEISFLDTVSQTDQVKILNDFAAADPDFIIGWGWEFYDAVNIVAEENPDIPFSITCAPMPGSEGTLPNVASMYFAEEEGGYLAGMLAGMLTETKHIGFLTGMDVPCACKTLNVYRQAAYEIDPEIQVDWALLGSWADVAKERELATALIDMGCDVIFALWVGIATADVCEEQGIHLIGSQALTEYKPEIVVADHLEDMNKSLKVLYEDVLNGNFRPMAYQMTMTKGVSDLKLNEALIPSVISYEIRDRIDDKRSAVLSGEFEVPRLVKIIPKPWPAAPFADYDEYLEEDYPNIYGHDIWDFEVE